MSDKYCWHNDAFEYRLNGPFDSVEECRQNILDSYLPEHEAKIVIAKAEIIMPEQWASGLFSVEDILERMDEVLNDHVSFDDCVFHVNQNIMEEAQKELDSFIVSWAIRHVHTDGEWRQGEVVSETTLSELRAGGVVPVSVEEVDRERNEQP